MDTDEAHAEEPTREPERTVRKVVVLVAMTLLSAVAGGITQAVTERLMGT
ncbi:hypothetical protein ACLIYM_23600 [Streptomyces fenghuangensis]